LQSIANMQNTVTAAMDTVTMVTSVNTTTGATAMTSHTTRQ